MSTISSVEKLGYKTVQSDPMLQTWDQNRGRVGKRYTESRLKAYFGAVEGRIKR